jgi:hypothetical protein
VPLKIRPEECLRIGQVKRVGNIVPGRKWLQVKEKVSSEFTEANNGHLWVRKGL